MHTVPIFPSDLPLLGFPDFKWQLELPTCSGRGPASSLMYFPHPQASYLIKQQILWPRLLPSMQPPLPLLTRLAVLFSPSRPGLLCLVPSLTCFNSILPT